MYNLGSILIFKYVILLIVPFNASTSKAIVIKRWYLFIFDNMRLNTDENPIRTFGFGVYVYTRGL